MRCGNDECGWNARAQGRKGCAGGVREWVERKGAKVALVGRRRLAGGGFLVAGARSVDVW